jgi:hypothetical protein
MIIRRRRHAQPIDTTAHADVTQRVAEAGIVLLRNQGRCCHCAKQAKRIVLIGGHADVGVLSGGGSSQVRSVGGVPIEIPLTSGAAASFARITYHASSPLRAIRALAPQAQVSYVDGSDPAAAAAAARDADIAIVFATQWTTEAQDPPSLALPDNQDALIASVAKANPKTVVVLETGGPVLMPWLEQVPAVVQAWYPGQRGGEAIAAILFGEVNPRAGCRSASRARRSNCRGRYRWCRPAGRPIRQAMPVPATAARSPPGTSTIAKARMSAIAGTPRRTTSRYSRSATASATRASPSPTPNSPTARRRA